jgi:hypothetical protein
MFEIKDCFLLTSLCENNGVYKTDVTYIHFTEKQLSNLWFNAHFLFIENKVYYEDLFVNPNIIDIIKNNKSDDIKHFNYILNNYKYTNLNFNKAIIFYINTCSPGHELASLTEMIYNYHENNLVDYDIIITEQIHKLGKSIVSMLYLFFDETKIHFINNLTCVHIKETYIINHFTNKQPKCIDFLIKKLDDNLIKLNYSIDVKNNLCLIKTTENRLFNSTDKSFSKDYNSFFKQHGFEIIIPEEKCITELYYLIKNCKKLILSWGSNSWVNSIYVKPSHNLITLCHINYANEYNSCFGNHEKNISTQYTQWTPLCNKNIMLYDLTTELSENIKNILIDSLQEITNE